MSIANDKCPDYDDTTGIGTLHTLSMCIAMRSTVHYYGPLLGGPAVSQAATVNWWLPYLATTDAHKCRRAHTISAAAGVVSICD